MLQVVQYIHYQYLRYQQRLYQLWYMNHHHNMRHILHPQNIPNHRHRIRHILLHIHPRHKGDNLHHIRQNNRHRHNLLHNSRNHHRQYRLLCQGYLIMCQLNYQNRQDILYLSCYFMNSCLLFLFIFHATNKSIFTNRLCSVII